jgi:hypothetical protein
VTIGPEFATLKEVFTMEPHSFRSHFADPAFLVSVAGWLVGLLTG